MLLWLWCRPATAALIQPIVWEFPYAAGEALKRKKKKKDPTYWCSWVLEKKVPILCGSSWPRGDATALLFASVEERVSFSTYSSGRLSTPPTIHCKYSHLAMQVLSTMQMAVKKSYVKMSLSLKKEKNDCGATGLIQKLTSSFASG